MGISLSDVARTNEYLFTFNIQMEYIHENSDALRRTYTVKPKLEYE